ncbi:MAG TPA: FAD-dependent oxidoreductase, partial [Alphaproteobacteria bacterium]|nr:FAD-dependent oxidoreductase [Alphaproteobacteria bacterium]
EFANKVASGRLNQIRRCISCENCIDSMFLWPVDAKMACAVNAATGRELRLRYDKAETPRRVVVIGGGPGGMEAARVATLRGHKVTLIEKSRKLGGSLTLASTVHSDNERFLNYLLGEMKRLNVDVRLGTTADAALVKSLGAEEVVVATGAKLDIPAIPGIDLPHVITGAQLRRLVAGGSVGDTVGFPGWLKLASNLGGGLIDRAATPARIRAAADRWLPIGHRVAIVGGDLAAIELAEFLAKRGRDVCVLAPDDNIAPEIGPKRRLEHEKRLERLMVAINVMAQPIQIVPTGIEIALPSGKTTLVAADTVIVAGNPVADTTLYDALKADGFSVHAVGDCSGLGLIVKAVYEGAEVANRI